MATAATTLWALATIKTYLRITDSARDTEITQIADAVTRTIERETRRQFVTRAVTEVHSGHGQRTLYLDNHPLTVVTTLKIKYGLTGAWNTIDSGDYTVDLVSGRIRLHNQTFVRGFENIEVVYTSGVAAQDHVDLPRDVYQGGLDMVKVVFDEKDKGVVGSSTVSVGPNSYVLRNDWPKSIAMMLRNNRRPM